MNRVYPEDLPSHNHKNLAILPYHNLPLAMPPANGFLVVL